MVLGLGQEDGPSTMLPTVVYLFGTVTHKQQEVEKKHHNS